MDEKGNYKDESKNFNFFNEDFIGKLLKELADNYEAMEKSVIASENDMEDVKKALDFCIQSRNTDNTCTETMKSKLTISANPSNNSDLFLDDSSKTIPETNSYEESETNTDHCSADAIANISKEESSVKGCESHISDEDTSLTFASEVSFTDFKDSESVLNKTIYPKESPRRILIENSTNSKDDENFTNNSLGDFVDSNSETSSDSANYSHSSEDLSDPLLTIANDMDRPISPLNSSYELKASGSNHILSDCYPDILKDQRYSYKNLKCCNTALYFSNRESEICLNGLKSSDRDQESRPCKPTLNVLLEEQPNLTTISPQIQNRDNQFTDESLDKRHTSRTDQRTSTSSDIEINKDFFTNYTDTQDDYDHLNTLLCTEDPNTEPKNDLSERNSDSFTTSTYSDSGSMFSLSDFRLSDSDTESRPSDIFKEWLKELKPDAQSSPKKVRNPSDTYDEFHSIVHKEDIIHEAFSDTELTSDKDVGTSVSSNEIKQIEESADSLSDDKEEGLIDDILYTDDPNALLKYRPRFNKIRSKSDTYSSSKSGHPHEESMPDLLQPNILNSLREFRNEMNTSPESQGNIEKDLTVIEISNKEQKSSNDRVSSVSTHETMENEASVDSLKNIHIDDVKKFFLRRTDTEGIQPNLKCSNGFLEKKDLKPRKLRRSLFSQMLDELPRDPRTSTNRNKRKRNDQDTIFLPVSFTVPRTTSNFPNIDSENYQPDLKFSNSDQETFDPKQAKILEEKLLEIKDKLKTQIRNTIDCTEDREDDPESLLDVFKTFIKCHPIRKFEIPPYESSNAERTVEMLDNPSTKYSDNDIQSYRVDDHRNILECLSDTDSHSVIVSDVTDCFSENSSIICDGLIREHLDISAKVDLLIIKQIKGISAEEYESRVLKLRSLDDELGYISAKLMTTMNDWIKQFREIRQNVEQFKIGSKGLHHMGILKICLQMAKILLTFCMEKQLKLEDYEKCLIFHRQ